MHTLFDFITNVNAAQYAIALLFMFGFVIFSEILKPRPFEGFARAVSEDIGFIKEGGREKIYSLIRAIVLAPLYAVIYIAAVPILFVHGIAVLFSKVLIATTAIGWSPARAYFASKKKRQNIREKAPDRTRAEREE